MNVEHRRQLRLVTCSRKARCTTLYGKCRRYPPPAAGIRTPFHAVVASGNSYSRPLGRSMTCAIGVAVGVAVVRPTHWKHARIVDVALFDEHVERPLQARHDREARRPISQHRGPGNVLEHVLRVPHILAELRGAQRRDFPVPPPVGRDLVPGRGDAPHDAWMPLGHPAKGEKSAGYPVARQHVEQPVHVVGHSTRKVHPGLARNDVVERVDLEVLFHVDREEMPYWVRHRS